MPKFPQAYAADRDWFATDGLDFQRYVKLRENWRFSQQRLQEIKTVLAQNKIPPEIATIAVAGSLGRMEAAEVSDCDLLVVLDNNTPTTEKAEPYYDAVWTALAPLKIQKPKTHGTFSKPTTQAQLCDKKNVGAPDEDMRVFAKRLLLLLETQPLFRPDKYAELVASVVDCYAEKYVRDDPRKEWGFLINDLIRYFRSICVNYQWDFQNEHGKWPLRNAKLRHSRLIMYGGLLALLGECSKERQNKVEWLRASLTLTPLERLAHVYAENGDHTFFRVAGYYELFLELLSDAQVRKSLNVEPTGSSYANRYQEIKPYAALKANSDGLVAELVRFFLSRRGSWTERFFEYLLF